MSTACFSPRRESSFWNGALFGDVAVVGILAMLTAFPWIDQRFAPLIWLALAVPLAAVHRLRGWRGETLVVAWAAISLAIAFQWAPAVITRSLDTSAGVGLLITVPVILWDAVRWSVPFWFVGRTVRDPLRAWLPAGLMAVVAEWFVPSIFPWKIGYAQIPWPATVQAADLFGPEITTLVAFAHAGVLVWLWHVAWMSVRVDVGGPDTAARSSLSPWSAVALAPLLVCAANLAYGVWAISHWTAAAAAAPRLRAAVVQVDPTPDDSTPVLQEWTRRICDTTGATRPFDVVVWPECSGGCYSARLESLADEEQVWRLSRDPNRGLRPLESPSAPLLFGGKIFTGMPEKPRTLHQSAILIDCAERIVGCYHKRHLMPFGEYVPGGEWLRDIKLLFPMEEEYDEGSEATVLSVPGKAALGVMLCYEDMVPSTARSLVRGGADVLVSLINGASFTDTLTLQQHRLLAQLRAVECRRSFIRCAATGETCLIDPVGAIAQRLPLHVQDVLVVEAPRLEARTVYATTGPVFQPAAAMVLGLIVGWHWRRRRAGTGGSATFGMPIVAGALVAIGASGCSPPPEQATDANAPAAVGTAGSPSGSAQARPADSPAGSGAGGAGGSGRSSGWFGGGTTLSSRDAFVRLQQVLQEAIGTIDEGDYAQIGRRVVAVRAALAQTERAFAASGLDPARAAEANRAVTELTNACGAVERVLRSGTEVSDIELEAFRGRVNSALALLERLAN